MARLVAALPAGTRVTDHVSFGVLAGMVPSDTRTSAAGIERLGRGDGRAAVTELAVRQRERWGRETSAGRGRAPRWPAEGVGDPSSYMNEPTTRPAQTSRIGNDRTRVPLVVRERAWGHVASDARQHGLAADGLYHTVNVHDGQHGSTPASSELDLDASA